MTDLQELKAVVDQLTGTELEDLYRHIEDRLRRTWWIVPSENIAEIEQVMRPVHEEASQMTDEEINQAIDDAITQVRHERKASRHL